MARGSKSDRDDAGGRNGTPASVEEVRRSIAERLAQLRMEHGYSIRTLAEHAGVSPSLISNAERAKVEPSIASLRRIAAALGTNPGYFLAEPRGDAGRVVREDERRPAENGARLATPEVAEALEVSVLRVDGGRAIDESTFTHRGEAWGIVLEGRLKVWVGGEFQFLGPGDSIWHQAELGHRVENPSEQTAEMLWARYGSRDVR